MLLGPQHCNTDLARQHLGGCFLIEQMEKTARSSELDLSLLREGQREGRERCSDEEKLEKIRKGSSLYPAHSLHRRGK